MWYIRVLTFYITTVCRDSVPIIRKHLVYSANVYSDCREYISLVLLVLWRIGIIIIYRSHAWWTREKVGEYFPIFSRDHPPLIEYLTKMKILQEKPSVKVANEPVKLILSNFRSLVGKIEASLFLWGVFTAGCTVIVTGYSNSPSKKK